MSWKTLPLGEISNIRPSKNEVKGILQPDDEVTFLGMEHLGIRQKFTTPQIVKKLNEVSGSYTYFAENDVLLAKITPCFENGKLGIAKNLVNGIGFGSSEFIVFRPKPELLNEWLYYFLLRDDFHADGARNMSGAVGHKRVNKEFIEQTSIPLPPLPTQQKIVAKLDAIFAEIDKATAVAEANARNAEALFQSYLTKVFGRGGEGWKLSMLNEISENLDSKRVPITKGVREAGDIPYYGASGIVDYVEGHIFDDDILLISEDGANLLARAYPIAFSVTGKSWVNNHAHVLKFANLATQYFVEFYLNSIPLNPYVSGMAQPKLNQTMLNKIPIPMPSLDEQIKLVDTFHAFKEASDTAKNAYLNKAHQLSALKNSILQQAFNGELVKD